MAAIKKPSVTASLLIASLLLSSGVLMIVMGQQSSSVANTWPGPEGPLHNVYSPQTQITLSNVAGITPRWIFPVPAAPGIYTGTGAEGVIITPVIANGIVYFITNWARLYAISATDGHIVWFQDLPQNNTEVQLYSLASNGLGPNPLGQNGPAGHYHEILYTTGIRNTPLIWVPGNDYHIYAYNALTGDLVINIQVLTSKTTRSIPGNFGVYAETTPTLVLDEKDGILVYGVAVSEAVNSGRGFFQGYDVNANPPKLLWTTFTIPPEDGSDLNWSLNSVASMSNAWIYNGASAVNLKALPASQLHDMLYADWGNFGFNGTYTSAGAAEGWGGSWEYDSTTGLAYVATGQPSPDFNATNRPGPNLWADAILAMNPKTGSIVWAFQTTAHDLYDWDCSWGVVTGDITVNGTAHHAVFKGCKNGILYALDGSTGQLLWSLKPPGTYWSPSAYSQNTGKLLHDPTLKADMTIPNQCYPKTHCIQFPGGTGAIEADFALDPTTNTIFLAGYNDGGPINIYDVGPKAYNGCQHKDNLTIYYAACGWWNDYGADTFPAGEGINSTIYGINANTGKVTWRYDIANVAFRGGVTASAGVVYVPLLDGTIRLLRETDGSLILSKLVAAPMVTQPAIGADTNGNMVIVQPAGSSSFFGVDNPGFVVAFGAPSPSSAPTVSVSTIVQQGPTTGIDPTLFYSVVAVAVIFIIATGFLAMRRRKPAS